VLAQAGEAVYPGGRAGREGVRTRRPLLIRQPAAFRCAITAGLPGAGHTPLLRAAAWRCRCWLRGHRRVPAGERVGNRPLHHNFRHRLRARPARRLALGATQSSWRAQAQGFNQLVAIRYPGVCLGSDYEKDYSAACAALQGTQGEFALLHDFRLLMTIDPWTLLKDAIAIVRTAKVCKVGFVFRDVGPIKNALFRRTVTTFCPVQPARVFLEPDVARAWCLTPE